jgi:hypothetical protein
MVFALQLAAPPAAFAAQWDGTDPGLTACGNGSHIVYTLGTRNSANKHGDQGFATNIVYNGLTIGKVEIRHSVYCATVWTRVTNLTSASVQAHEKITLWPSSNGTGTPITQTETDTLSANGGTGWSLQYRDRASFKAYGEIYYAGGWRGWTETARSVAWVQDDGAFADEPYGCDGSANHKCYRWPVASPGVSATFHYGIAPGVYSMPNGSGGTVDVSGDVIYEFNQFNGVPAPSPFFYWDTYNYAEVHVDAVAFDDGPAQTYRSGDPSTGLYYAAEIQLNTNFSWGSSSSNRTVLCHETDHVMGLHHVWWHNASDIDNVGSKATCIGQGPNVLTAPSTDDVSALKWVYAGVLP